MKKALLFNGLLKDPPSYRRQQKYLCYIIIKDNRGGQRLNIQNLHFLSFLIIFCQIFNHFSYLILILWKKKNTTAKLNRVKTTAAGKDLSPFVHYLIYNVADFAYHPPYFIAVMCQKYAAVFYLTLRKKSSKN